MAVAAQEDADPRQLQLDLAQDLTLRLALRQGRRLGEDLQCLREEAGLHENPPPVQPEDGPRDVGLDGLGLAQRIQGPGQVAGQVGGVALVGPAHERLADVTVREGDLGALAEPFQGAAQVAGVEQDRAVVEQEHAAVPRLQGVQPAVGRPDVGEGALDVTAAPVKHGPLGPAEGDQLLVPELLGPLGRPVQPGQGLLESAALELRRGQTHEGAHPDAGRLGGEVPVTEQSRGSTQRAGRPVGAPGRVVGDALLEQVLRPPQGARDGLTARPTG